jgi:DNA-binding transcriptional regulator YdaS (Cro superfamily)
MNAIVSAIEFFGSSAQLAEAVGVSTSMVDQWRYGVRPIPVKRCVLIEKVTRGRARRWDLRPDDWGHIWPELIGRKGAPHWRAESAEAA